MSKSISFIDLGAQQRRLNNKIQARIDRVLSHGKYIIGPEVLELEKKLKDFSKAAEVVTCGSGTDAIILALLAYNIGPGDAVFCPTFTFPATAEAIALVGATPIFVDVDERTFNISIKDLDKAISVAVKKSQYNIRAILSVDLFGLPANYSDLNNIARKNNMILIADAAQSFGAEYFSKRIGTLADITCVSFFPAKPLGCYGDGGAVLTDDITVAQRIKSLRVHGKGKSKYEIEHIGLNSRLDTLQAAVLLAKLEEFEWEIEARNKIAHNYSTSLSKYLTTPFVPSGYKSVWAQYTVKHEDRDRIQMVLKGVGIPAVVYYPLPIHLQTPYKKYNAYGQSFPIAESLSADVLSLPIYPDMNMEEQDYIISELINIL